MSWYWMPIKKDRFEDASLREKAYVIYCCRASLETPKASKIHWQDGAYKSSGRATRQSMKRAEHNHDV